MGFLDKAKQAAAQAQEKLNETSSGLGAKRNADTWLKELGEWTYAQRMGRAPQADREVEQRIEYLQRYEAEHGQLPLPMVTPSGTAQGPPPGTGGPAPTGPAATSPASTGPVGASAFADPAVAATAGSGMAAEDGPAGWDAPGPPSASPPGEGFGTPLDTALASMPDPAPGPGIPEPPSPLPPTPGPGDPMPGSPPSPIPEPDPMPSPPASTEEMASPPGTDGMASPPGS